MEKKGKRALALLCALALVCTGIGVRQGILAEASGETETAKEWTLLTDHAGSSASNTTVLLQKTDLGLNLTGKTNDDMENLGLYIRVTLADQAAVSKMAGCTIELSQSTNDHAELQWGSGYGMTDRSFSVGENEICLLFSEAKKIVSTDDSLEIDLSKTINHFRIFNTSSTTWSGVTINEVKVVDRTPVVTAYAGGATAGTAPADVPAGYLFAGWFTDEACTTALIGNTAETAYAKFVNADVLTVKTQMAAEEEILEAVFSNCDTLDGLTLGGLGGRVSTEAEYTTYHVPEGTCAILNSGNGQVRYTVTRSETMDVTGYKTLHLYFWIGNINVWNGNLRVEIGNSSTTYDSNFIQWEIDKSTLQSGWNELNLDISDMTGRNGTDILSKINWMRIYMKGGATTDNSSIVTGIDDIRFTNDLPGKVLSDLDSGAGYGLAALTNGEVTTNADYVKEGSGALLNTSGTQQLFRFTMMPVNIADYTNGYLHFWLYISNTSAWNGTVNVELTSSGAPDTNELQWNLDKSTLQNGWNEVELALSDPSSRKGTINYSAVNFLRIFQASGAASAALTVALDDLRVCPYDSYSKADLRFVTSVDDLNYQKVGYNITINSVTKNVSSNTVYQKLYAVDSDSTVLSYHPYDACHGMSNYFYTYSIWNIPADAFSTAITVQPYWVTLDGTTVYGAAVERSVNTILGK